MKDTNSFTSMLVDWSTGLDVLDDFDEVEGDSMDVDPHWTGLAAAGGSWYAPGGFFCAEWELMPYCIDLIIAGTYGRKKPTLRFAPRPRHFPAWINHCNRPDEQRLMTFTSERHRQSPSAVTALVEVDLTQHTWARLIADPQVEVDPFGRPRSAEGSTDVFALFLQHLDDDAESSRGERPQYASRLQDHAAKLRRKLCEPARQLAFMREMATTFSTNPESCHKVADDRLGQTGFVVRDAGNLSSVCMCDAAAMF